MFVLQELHLAGSALLSEKWGEKGSMGISGGRMQMLIQFHRLRFLSYNTISADDDAVKPNCEVRYLIPSRRDV